MNITFHLAINVNDIEKSKRFYCEILGCELGDYEEGKWQDVNFWGNELTLHKSESTITQEIHPVDMGKVPVPHFGVHLDFDVYEAIKKRIESQTNFSISMSHTCVSKENRENKKLFLSKIPVETCWRLNQ